MESGTHTWVVQSFRERDEESVCLYGPQFRIGSSLLQCHLHLGQDLNRWPEPGALFLRFVAHDGEANRLRIQATFDVPELHFSGSVEKKDDLARWQGGFGPSNPEALNKALLAYKWDRLTIKVTIDILEVESPCTTILRWPLGNFQELRGLHASTPCEAGFHRRLCRRFEVHGPEFGTLAFRADLHPNIDATGNLYVSFKLDRADPKVQQLEAIFDVSLEELDYSSRSEPLRGSRSEWSRALGLAASPTQCPELRTYDGPLTLRLSLTASLCAAVEPKDDPHIWSSFVHADFRYLLISAAGPLVAGEAEPQEAWDQQGRFAHVCACNIARLHGYLLDSGVPEENVARADYSGDEPQPHPRDLLEKFLADTRGAAKLVVYFSGHAVRESGSWCFRWLPQGQNYSADVFVAPEELFDWRDMQQTRVTQVPLEVIAEANGSGAWCLAAKTAKLRGRVLAASAPYRQAWARHDGSLFTDWLIGRSRAIERVEPPGGPQTPWEYSRLSAAGPMLKLLRNTCSEPNESYQNFDLASLATTARSPASPFGTRQSFGTPARSPATPGFNGWSPPISPPVSRPATGMGCPSPMSPKTRQVHSR